MRLKHQFIINIVEELNHSTRHGMDLDACIHQLKDNNPNNLKLNSFFFYLGKRNIGYATMRYYWMQILH